MGCDSYYNHSDINGYNGTNPFLHPGALLAVPPSHVARLASSLTTSIGHKLLAALTVRVCAVVRRNRNAVLFLNVLLLRA